MALLEVHGAAKQSNEGCHDQPGVDPWRGAGGVCLWPHTCLGQMALLEVHGAVEQSNEGCHDQPG